MKVLSCFLLAGSLAFGPQVLAQQPAVPSAGTSASLTIANPFDEVHDDGMMSMGDGGYEGMGMGMSGGVDRAGIPGTAGMPGMMSSQTVSPDELFHSRLRKAIKRIGAAKSEDEKAVLTKYTEKGIADFYDAMIARRKEDLARLKNNLSKLEMDLTRREAAKDRVVRLQLQSAILAAEGLLDLDSLQPASPGGEGMEMGMEVR